VAAVVGSGFGLSSLDKNKLTIGPEAWATLEMY
jgi:hypothetical protein